MNEKHKQSEMRQLTDPVHHGDHLVSESTFLFIDRFL